MLNWNDKFWSYWQRTWLFPERLEKWTIQKSIEEIAGECQGVLLDIGCGSKPYFDLLREKVHAYIGIEYPLSINANTTKADVYGNGSALPIKSDLVDVVFSTQNLEHLPQPEKFFKEANRVLKHGGKLFLTTNQEWGIHKDPYDFFRFTRYGLEYLCESAGLERVTIKNRGGFWVMIGQRFSAYVFERWVNRFRKNHKLIFLVTFIITAPLIAVIQLSALLVDKIDYIETNTIGYFLKAKKP